MNKIGIWIVAIVVVFMALIWWSRSLQKEDPNLVSTRGIHWHPGLSIVIDGVEAEIPPNIGLVGGHAPIHTHNDETDLRETGKDKLEHKPLHLEFGSVVRSKDIHLGNFFDIWGKTFNSECIFSFCTADGGTLLMTVNGEVNTEYENYVMGDRDSIEIIYTSATSSQQ